MNIALDYDGTFTRDPWFWLQMVDLAQRWGHKVTVVTMRYPSELHDVDPRLLAMGVQVIPTSRLAKREVTQIMGLDIHIWIDDEPRAIDNHAQTVWGQSSPEGTVVIPQ